MQNGHIEIEFPAAMVVGQKERRCAMFKHFIDLLIHQFDLLISGEHKAEDEGVNSGADHPTLNVDGTPMMGSIDMNGNTYGVTCD